MNYLIVFFLLAVLSFVYLKIAEKYNIIDKPNHRSSHIIATIRGGGILFYIAVLIFFFLNDFQYPFFVLGVTIIAIVSFIDDLLTLSSKMRLPFQFLAIFLLLFEIDLIHYTWIIIPLFIMSVAFINIYNFMDGINGITGMYSISVLVGLFLINHQEQIINPNLILFSSIAVLVFGYYNFRKKARFFAGDIGSISIAMVLLFIGMSLIYQLNSPLIILCVAVYGADAIITLLYRKSIGEKITEAHRHHIYQKLVDTFKISHLKVSFIYFIIQLLINLIVYQFYNSEAIVQWTILCLVSIILILVYIFIFNKTKYKLR